MKQEGLDNLLVSWEEFSPVENALLLIELCKEIGLANFVGGVIPQFGPDPRIEQKLVNIDVRYEKVGSYGLELRHRCPKITSGSPGCRAWAGAPLFCRRGTGRHCVCLLRTANCLNRALPLRMLLARREIASELHIGACRDPQGAFAAHAWLTCKNVILVGGDEALTCIASSSAQATLFWDRNFLSKLLCFRKPLSAA